MLVDVSKINVGFQKLKKKIRNVGVKLGSGVSVEDAEAFKQRRKLVAFDLDGTLIENECINELAKVAGAYREVKEITRKAMNGEIDFRESLKRRVKLLKGLPLKEVEKIKRKLKISPGAEELISELKKAGFTTAIISGGFDVFAEHVAEILGIDYVYANRLKVRSGKLTGEVEEKVITPQDKLKALKEIASKEKISLSECVAIGDGANDIFLLEGSGLGIGYNPKDFLKKRVSAILETRDLKPVLALIGVSQTSQEVKKRIS
jgi:phosphoserine phosphatase